MVAAWLVSLLLLLLPSIAHSQEPSPQVGATSTQSSYEDQKGLLQLNGKSDWEILPNPDLESQFHNSTRRQLGSFNICALCTCCGEGRRFCIPTACCYTITCGSPNRPFGLCSFTPLACNCFDCHL